MENNTRPHPLNICVIMVRGSGTCQVNPPVNDAPFPSVFISGIGDSAPCAIQSLTRMPRNSRAGAGRRCCSLLIKEGRFAFAGSEDGLEPGRGRVVLCPIPKASRYSRAKYRALLAWDRPPRRGFAGKVWIAEASGALRHEAVPGAKANFSTYFSRPERAAVPFGRCPRHGGGAPHPSDGPESASPRACDA